MIRGSLFLSVYGDWRLRFDLLHIALWQNWLNYWPVIVIAVGIVKAVDSTWSSIS